MVFGEYSIQGRIMYIIHTNTITSAAGATSQMIFVEGTSYSGAWTWVSAGNDALSALTDPQNNIVYEMHQYLDSDSSGTSSTCVSSTIGSERLAAATAWLKSSGKKAILGEFAGGANSVCESAVTDMLTYIGENTDVWEVSYYVASFEFRKLMACRVLSGGVADHGGVTISSRKFCHGVLLIPDANSYSMEPPSGVGYTDVLPLILPLI